MALSVTRLALEAVTSIDSNIVSDARISRQAVEAVTSIDSNIISEARISRQAIEVLTTFEAVGQLGSVVTATATLTATAHRMHYGLRCILRADSYASVEEPLHTPLTHTLNGIDFGTYIGTAVFSDDLLDNFSDGAIITALNNWSGSSNLADRSDLKRVTDTNSRAYNKPCLTNATEINRGLDLGLVNEKRAPLVYDLVTELAELEPIIITAWVKMATTALDPVVGKWGLLRVSNSDDTDNHSGVVAVQNWHDRLTVTPMSASNPAFMDATAAQNEAWPDLKEVGDWSRIDCVIIPSTIGTRDGTIQIFRYDNAAVLPRAQAVFSISHPSGNPWDFNGDVEVLSAAAEQFRYVILDNWLGDGLTSNSLASNSNQVWLDSIMIQRGSLQRVELCDNADYTQASHCEVQQVTSWNEGDISINVKQGSMLAGTAYLHVIDEANNSIHHESITLY